MSLRVAICIFLLLAVDCGILAADASIQVDRKTIVRCNVSDKTTPPQIACMFKLGEPKGALSLYVDLLIGGYEGVRKVDFLTGNRTLILTYWVFKNVKSDGKSSHLEIELIPELEIFFERHEPFIVLKKKRTKHLIDLCIIPW